MYNLTNIFANRVLPLVAFMALVLAGCKDDEVVDCIPSNVDDKEWTFDQNMDTDRRPGDDFFMYCNGAWWDATDLGGSPIVGLMYDEADDVVNTRMATVNKDARFVTLANQVHNFEDGYASADAAISARMAELEGITTRKEAWRAFAGLVKGGYDDLLAFAVEVRGGRAYATFSGGDDDEEEKTVGRVSAQLRRAGMDDAKAAAVADKAVRARKRLAAIPRLDLSLPSLIAHPEIHERLVPHLNTRTGETLWDILLEELGLTNENTLSYPELEEYLAEVEALPVDELVAAMQSIVSGDYIYVSQEAIDELNAENGLAYTIDDIYNGSVKVYLSYLTSYVYATTYVTPQLKADYTEKVLEMKAAFRERINAITWMSSTTKARALNKLEQMTLNVGYPDEWVEEGLPALDGASLTENVMQLREAHYKLFRSFVGRSGKDVSFNYLIATPDYSLSIINAFYVSLFNSMNIYPVFMLPPLYDTSYSDAYNYAVFAVIGHEMTHGFDSDGANYNELGGLENWWTVADRMEFEDRLQLLVDCYNHLELLPSELPGVYGNGEQTLGENVADLGGLLIAHQAYVSWLQREGYYGDELLKQERKFFQGYAELWRSKYGAEYVNWALPGDVHSTNKERVNGVVMNCDRWYELYDVQWGDKLYLNPERRTYIW